jgi:cysteine desulfurase
MKVMTQPVYLDYAAATPIDEAVLVAMMPYFTDTFYNPSASYLPAIGVHKALQAARSQLVLPKPIIWQFVACLNFILAVT